MPPFSTYSPGCTLSLTLHSSRHPHTDPGPKSSAVATQVIEAHYLFGADYDHIDIVIHPQSIIHSMVETQDSSVLAQVRSTTADAAACRHVFHGSKTGHLSEWVGGFHLLIDTPWKACISASARRCVLCGPSIAPLIVGVTAVTCVAQLGWPDMRLPILYTMSWPERVPCADATWPRLDFVKMGDLTFRSPDRAKYPAMDLAFAAGRAGGTMTGVLSAANEQVRDLLSSGVVGVPASNY